MRTFGLSVGLSVSIVLNLPMLEFKTMIPLSIWGLIGAGCLIYDLVKTREKYYNEYCKRHNRHTI